MSPIADSALQRLHELAWRPGAWMHERWWARLDLAHWQAVYFERPVCRPSIDRLIAVRRAFCFQHLPASLNDTDRTVVGLEPRMPAILTALGIVALGCADHVILKSHRQALRSTLDARSCSQLLALHDDWDAGATPLAPQVLRDAAFFAGVRWWQRDAARSLPASLLSTLLPPVDDTAPAIERCAIGYAVKLSRFVCSS